MKPRTVQVGVEINGNVSTWTAVAPPLAQDFVLGREQRYRGTAHVKRVEAAAPALLSLRVNVNERGAEAGWRIECDRSLAQIVQHLLHDMLVDFVPQGSTGFSGPRPLPERFVKYLMAVTQPPFE